MNEQIHELLLLLLLLLLDELLLLLLLQELQLQELNLLHLQELRWWLRRRNRPFLNRTLHLPTL